MLKTVHGIFNGDSWEHLCQLIFKKKFAVDGYQQMVAAPGDFGIEGFTKTGTAYQCYCPSEEYTRDVLYEKQRDKITKDLEKLRTYESQIKERIGSTVITQWVFVTPIISSNDILRHCENKKSEVLGWSLGILSPTFDVLVHDAGFYETEIKQLQNILGESLSFDTEVPPFDFVVSEKMDHYQANINRKNRFRLPPANQNRVTQLNSITIRNLVDGNAKLQTINKAYPDIFYKVVRILSQFERDIEEICLTWTGDAQSLIEHVKKSLSTKIEKELSILSVADRDVICSHMIAKWLAICTIDFQD